MTNNEQKLTIQEVIELTGKSESTVRRWVKELKKTKPELLSKGKDGRKTFYLIPLTTIQQSFKIKKEQPTTEQEGKRKQNDEQIPEPYKTMIDILNNQLQAKDKQIENLNQQNFNLTGTIATFQRQLLPPTENMQSDPENSVILEGEEEKPPTTPKKKTTSKTDKKQEKRKTNKTRKKTASSKITKKDQKKTKNRKIRTKKGFFSNFFKLHD